MKAQRKISFYFKKIYFEQKTNVFKLFSAVRNSSVKRCVTMKVERGLCLPRWEKEQVYVCISASYLP